MTDNNKSTAEPAPALAEEPLGAVAQLRIDLVEFNELDPQRDYGVENN